MANLESDFVAVVEEQVWDDLRFSNKSGDERPRWVRFVRVRARTNPSRGNNRATICKVLEVFLETGQVLTARVIPEGAEFAPILKELLQETTKQGFDFLPTDLNIGGMCGRLCTLMEFKESQT